MKVLRRVALPVATLVTGIVYFAKRLWVPVGLVVVWQYVAGSLLPQWDSMASTLLPPPSTVIAAGMEMISRGELLKDALASMKRELIGVGLAVIIAIPLGVAIGWWRGFGEAVGPLFELLRPIPVLAWIPLSILWFGIGDAQNQFVIFLAAFFPMMLNTIAGVQGIDRNLVRAALCHGAGQRALLWKVIIPGALPQIFLGVRIGVGIGWMALVAAELVAATSGLGFGITHARDFLRSDQVIVGMVTIGILGICMDALLRLMFVRLIPWHESVR